MKIKSISFENYKAFAEKQTLELKPITLLIGKNSSGKSSIAKLFTLLENSLSGKIQEPLLMNNNGVELGAEFKDLVFGRYPNTPISFGIEYEDNTILAVKIVQDDSYKLNILEWRFNNFLIQHSKEEGYIDSDGNRYKCIFQGICLHSIINEKGENILDYAYDPNHEDLLECWIKINELAINVDYIGPFRILPERQFHLTGQVNYSDTGIKGENAYSMLGVSKLMKNSLHEKVGEWYKTHFDGWELKVNDKNKPYIEILLSKNDTDVNIVDVGQGMNQVLPLVTRSNIKRPNSIIVLEQPELHLHPAAHGDIAELFAKSAKENNQTFLIETHSENIILRLRSLIVENTFGFTKDDIIIYWVDDAEGGGQEINEITIDEEGVLSDWPDGVFNENIKEILAMENALNKKHKPTI